MIENGEGYVLLEEEDHFEIVSSAIEPKAKMICFWDKLQTKI